MKKLLLAGLLLFSISLAAQKRLAYSILTGPGWMQPFSGLKDGSAVRSQIGWTAACEVSFEIARRWDFKTTLQYHQAKLVAGQGNLLPAIKLENSAWHYSFGTRWYCTPPGIWQWYADVGLGTLLYSQEERPSKGSRYFTGGLGFGLQWLPPEKQFGLFMQPMLRYATCYQGRKLICNQGIVLPSVEIGLRAVLFKSNN